MSHGHATGGRLGRPDTQQHQAPVLRDDLSFGLESPLTADLDLLFRRHEADMRAETPPESIHMVPRERLAAAGIAFFVLRRSGRPVGMAALKTLDPAHAEIKSMHVLAEARGRGLSRLMLDHLIAHARQSGVTRVSLETGMQPGFGAARALYRGAGFRDCPPFADYRSDPNSVFMTLAP